ncbi:MAG: hypothetical protein ISR65_08020 [Bacteriovoracaceae bacterium]|nr:hypothetical protein [Bacteriovoracaceae bacterium]
MNYNRYCHEHGNVTFLSLLCIFSISSLFLLLVLKMQKTSDALILRAKTYLCFKYYLNQTRSYIQNIAAQNLILSQPIDQLKKIGLENAQMAQNKTHATYLKRLQTNRYCPSTQSTSFMSTLPYKTNSLLQLVRDKADSTTILRKSKWNIFLPSSHFTLQATFFLQNRFHTVPSLKVVETKTKAW